MRDPRFALPHEDYPPTSDDTVQQVRALACEVALGPVDLDRLRNAHRKLKELQGGKCWRLFETEFLTGIRAHRSRAREWSAVLVDAALATMAGPDFALLQEDARALAAKVEARARMRSPFDVWRDGLLRDDDTRVDYAPFADLELALRVDAATAVYGLEKVPSVDLMCRALEGVSDDPEVLLDVITTSQAVYDEAGQWLPSRSLVAVLAMDPILGFAERLLRAVGCSPNALLAHEHDDAKMTALRTGEILPWFEKAFRAVLTRRDGAAICEAYLVELCRKSIVDSDLRSPWSLTADALSTLVGELRASCDVSALRTAWELEEEHAVARAKLDAHTQRWSDTKRPRRLGAYEGDGARSLRGGGLCWLVAASHLAISKTDAAGAPADLASWFRALLRGRDDDLSLALRDGHAVAAAVEPIARVLSDSGDLETELRAAYAELEPQRRRGHYHLRYEDYDFNLPSVLLLRVGISALCYATGRHPPSHYENLLLWIFDRARRLWLTGVHDPGDYRAKTLPLAFALVPHVCSTRTQSMLERMVPWIQNTPEQLCFATYLLWKNVDGRDASYAAQLVSDAGGDVTAALRFVLGYAALTGREQQVSPSVRELAEALGVRPVSPPL